MWGRQLGYFFRVGYNLDQGDLQLGTISVTEMKICSPDEAQRLHGEILLGLSLGASSSFNQELYIFIPPRIVEGSSFQHRSIPFHVPSPV